MPRTDDEAVRVAGTWLAIASFLMIATLVAHGPVSPDLEEQMRRIAEGSTRWSAVHWIAAAALSLYAVTALIALTARSRLIRGRWTTSAWAVVAVGALWTMTTAVAEATVVADAAALGAAGTFEAWWAFSEGKATGFSFLALAVAAIAAGEARAAGGIGPTWAAWLAVVAGVGSFGGWALGMWFGVPSASLAWVACSVVMSAWTLWFGVGLARTRPPASRARRTSAPAATETAPRSV